MGTQSEVRWPLACETHYLDVEKLGYMEDERNMDRVARLILDMAVFISARSL